MKMRLAIPALAAILLTPAAMWAQAGGAAAAASATKIGVIDVQVAITSTAEGKQAAAELQSQFAPRQTELTNMQKQMEDIQTRLRTGQTTLSDDEKARLGREGEQLQRSYQRRSQDAQDDFNEAQREIVDRIGRRMIDVLNKYSRDNGYSIILDRSGQASPVIFAANSTDVTQEIIRLFDQSYPVKASAATPRTPAAAKPAPKPAAPQQ
ncbi:MAG TPA: OmpH family outer membrane protein [Candidatus Acidoferrales bacterium]